MDATASDAAPLDQHCCPHLGLAEDRETRYLFPSPAHRCWSHRRPAGIDETHQASWCLVARHIGCSRFTRPMAASARRTGLAGLVPADDDADAPGAPQPTLLAEPGPAAAGASDASAGAGGRGAEEDAPVHAGRGRLVALLFLVAVVALAGAALIALGPPSLGGLMTNLGLDGGAGTPLPTAPIPGTSPR